MAALCALLAFCAFPPRPAEASSPSPGSKIVVAAESAGIHAVPVIVAGASLSEQVNSEKALEMVRAKFKVTRIERTETSRGVVDAQGQPVKDERGYQKQEPCEMRTLHLAPVYGNGDPNHENTKFWQASPSGSIQLGCVNLAAAEQFELGKEYYIDFTPAS